ncbi:hypothetical protein [Nocardia thailandica]|uniref:hypothetical protein n=1 Tax=Nocardia thailandica TaxID=257275 RepID=UPI00030361E0|nr:hypothetical protein [Nocardia thailandica]
MAEATGTTPEKTSDDQPQPTTGTIAVRASTLVGSAVIAVLAVIAVVLGVLAVSARSEVSDLEASAADSAHAERVALDYSVGAATLDFQNVNAWVGKLKAGTSPELAAKFDATGTKLEAILVPLKWTSTATPITAKVTSQQGDVYKVAAFVDVNTNNAQNPDGLRNTVTYNITVDKSKNWQITDVGSVDGALPMK